MENYKQKIILSLTKNKNGYRYSNSSKKIVMKRYNPTNKNILLPKRPIITQFLYKTNNNKNNIHNYKISNSFGKKRSKNRNISYNLLDYSNNSYKKTISLNNSTKKYILKLKNKIFNNINKDINYTKALKSKKSNYSFIKSNINKNKLYKNVIKDNNSNISNDKNSFFQVNNNKYMNNINTNTNYLDSKKAKQHIITDPYSLIYQKNKKFFQSNTYNDLEIICEGINNNINNINTNINNINNININYLNNKKRKIEISPKDKNSMYKVFEKRKIKKNKSTYITSINNSNYANILNYNIFTKKKNSNKKKIKSKQNKNQNKSTSENYIKYKLNELREKMEKLFEENEKSSTKKYNIIKDKFDESINIMGLNEDEKNFLKLIMNKYNDVISSYTKENKNLKKTSEQFQNLNSILDKKYLDLESKYNENIKLLKKYQKNTKQFNEVKKSNDSIDNKKFNKDRNFRKKDKSIELLNMLNVNDLNSLYFNDKINPLSNKNAEENYKKVPILDLNNLK